MMSTPSRYPTLHVHVHLDAVLHVHVCNSHVQQTFMECARCRVCMSIHNIHVHVQYYLLLRNLQESLLTFTLPYTKFLRSQREPLSMYIIYVHMHALLCVHTCTMYMCTHNISVLL